MLLPFTLFYNNINLLVYLLVIPIVWTLVLDSKVKTKYLITLSYVLCITIAVILQYVHEIDFIKTGISFCIRMQKVHHCFYAESCFIYCILLPLTTTIILIIFNSFTHVTVYAMAEGKIFPILLQQEKRDKYLSDYYILKATHYKLNKHDYYYHDRMQRAYLQRYNNGQDKGEDTLIILRFTHVFKLLCYTYGDDGRYEDVVEKSLLDGFDANYNNGNLIYNKDSIFTNMDTFYFDQARHAGHTIHEETDIEVEVIPQTIDDYAAYREKGNIVASERSMDVSLGYLKSKGIPVQLGEYPKYKQ